MVVFCSVLVWVCAPGAVFNNAAWGGAMALVGWSGLSALEKFGARDCVIECEFVGFDVSNVFLKVGGGVYGLVDAGGFSEWVYLVAPGEFVSTTRGAHPSFVEGVRVRRVGARGGVPERYRVYLTVNSVLASPDAGGVAVERRRFVLVFQ